MHLILIADTGDHYIGQTAQKSCNIFKNDFAPTLKERMNLSAINIIDNVDLDISYRFETNPDDVIVFYYNGHGFNTGNDEYFPALCQGMVYQGQKVIYLQDIFNNLKLMPHKLMLVIAETSNSIHQLNISRQTPIVFPSAIKVYGENYIVSSSSRGQYTYSQGDRSLFMQAFIEAFESDINLSWRNILDNTVSKTKQLAEEIGVIQTPQWEMN